MSAAMVMLSSASVALADARRCRLGRLASAQQPKTPNPKCPETLSPYNHCQHVRKGTMPTDSLI